MAKAIEVIPKDRQQYLDNRMGRWAAIEESSGEFIGRSCWNFITEPENNQMNFCNVGYWLIPKYWGKVDATESAKAALEFGFKTMNLKEIIGRVIVEIWHRAAL